MDDKKIVELFLSRDEQAIKEAQDKYGKYCRYIANNILNSDEDSEECVNDTLLRAWNSIPPAQPENLKLYLGKITRNLSLDLYAKGRAKKRSEATRVAFDELSECIPDSSSDTQMVEELGLKKSLNEFLSSLDSEKRIIFMQRYWYLSSVKDIAANRGLSQANVKIILLRLRAKFKKFLEKEGINL